MRDETSREERYKGRDRRVRAFEHDDHGRKSVVEEGEREEEEEEEEGGEEVT